MAIKSRAELKAIFSNGKKLSSSQFEALIESLLNKKDDGFMGKWKPGISYYPGAVVIYDNTLWQVPDGENGAPICSVHPPNEDEWEKLILPQKDDDWEVVENEGEEPYMYAKVYNCVGIGEKFLHEGLAPPQTPEKPEAILEVAKNIEPPSPQSAYQRVMEDPSAAMEQRFLIFPKDTDKAVLKLMEVENELGEKAYFLMGLDDNNVDFITDKPRGFVFKFDQDSDQGENTDRELTAEGDIKLVVIEPHSNGLAKVGISTPHPEAMLHITDGETGAFLFNPDSMEDPVFNIVNLKNPADKNYLSAGVGQEYAAFVSDARKGFVFRCGPEYSMFCKDVNLNQGKAVLVIRCGENNSSEVGIGTEEPCGLIDAVNPGKGRFLVQAEEDKGVAVSMVNTADESPYYFTHILSDDKIAFTTDASRGYTINRGDQIEEGEEYCENLGKEPGELLVSILPNGNVGMGTPDPQVHLEINDLNSGKFLFNLDNRKPNPAMGIVNTRPGRQNYMTIGVDNDSSVFITDSDYGFSFRIPTQDTTTTVTTRATEAEIDKIVDTARISEVMFAIVPKNPKGGIPAQSEVRIFPEKPQTQMPQGHLKVSAKTGIYRDPVNYELDINGTSRSLGYYTLADRQKRDPKSIEDMGEVLDKLLLLNPIKFEWNNAKIGWPNDEGKQFGFEDIRLVEEHFGEAVKTSPDQQDDQTKAIAYGNLVPVLVKAIQELKNEINELRAMINEKES